MTRIDQHKKTFLIYRLLCAVLILSLFPWNVVHAEEKTPALWPAAPEITAQGAILIEVGTGAVLYDKQSEEKFYPASTTKLMTALLALENTALGETVTVSHNAVYDIDTDSSRLWVDEGEQLSMEDSLYALMLPSANDLAYAIAEHVAGTKQDFSKMMNDRAAALGCVNSHFINPHGLDEDGHYSCPADLAKIMRQLIKFPAFLRISGSKNHEILPTNKCKESRWIANTHQMIRGTYSFEGILAGKTGHTDLAGGNLVTYAKRNGVALICVVMKTTDDAKMYDDTAALLNYGFNNFKAFSVDEKCSFGQSDFPQLFSKEDSVWHLGNNTPITSELSYIMLPISESDTSSVERTVAPVQLTHFDAGRNVIGSISYRYGDHIVGSAELVFFNSGEAFSLPQNSEEPSPTDSPSVTPDPNAPALAPLENDPTSETPSDSVNRRPIIIGIVVGSVCFFIGVYFLFVELPYQRKKNDYMKHHKRY